MAYPNPFRQRVNIEYSGQQPITTAYLLTLVTQDGHRHTVRLLKQSEVFGM